MKNNSDDSSEEEFVDSDDATFEPATERGVTQWIQYVEDKMGEDGSQKVFRRYYQQKLDKDPNIKERFVDGLKELEILDDDSVD